MNDFGLLSVLPPILTIVLAILTRNIIVSLAIGVFSGAFILSGYHPFDALLSLVEDVIFVQLSVPANTQVIITLAAIGGFVKLLEESGGAKAFAKKITRYISNPFQAQLAAWFGGLGIFFTDSGNSLILGPLFQPIFRELKICKEKLAFILDTTSSPICILMPFIGWGAYIMSLIEQSYTGLGIQEDPFTVLLHVMPYQFYAILALVSVPLIAFLGRDFGPMAKAQNAFNTEQKKSNKIDGVIPYDDGNKEVSIWTIILPLGVLFLLIAGLLTYHYMKTFSLSGVHIRSTLIIAYLTAAITCALVMRFLSRRPMQESLKLFIKGVEKMVFIMFILMFAWSLSDLCTQLHTGEFIAEQMKGVVSPNVFPVIVFLSGAFISLSTGSSYGTFAILMAIAIPVAVELNAPLYVTIAAVLSGGLFGDHTSPISDTTVLASMGANCIHIRHVITQLFYASLTGLVAAFSFYLASVYKTPYIIILGIAIQIILFSFIMKYFGVRSKQHI